MDTREPRDRLKVAEITALLALPFAIYAAFWVIDWEVRGDSLLRYLLPVAFCVVVPSALGSITQAVVGYFRRAD